MARAAAVTAAVSARRIRGPRVTGRAGHWEISSGEMPPSGPTRMPISRAWGKAAKRSRMRVEEASSHGTIITSRFAMSESASFQESTGLISMTRARRHCFTASRAMRSSRSVRRSPSPLATLRAMRTGVSRATPSSVSFWARNSSFSALGRP